MKLEEFIKLVADMPLIDTELLLAGVSNPGPAKVQISRWEKAGKLIQLKRGLYVLASPYRKKAVYGPFIAATLKQPSYISMEKALEFHNLIPEAVTVWTSVTPKRPARFRSQEGDFEYSYIKKTLFWGYKSVTLDGQTGFVATPEKALLDFFCVRKIKPSQAYLEEMRLQNLEDINLNTLLAYARKFNKPGILRTAQELKEFIAARKGKEEKL